MPKGPNGEKRTGHVIGAVIQITQIATGEEEKTRDEISIAATEMGRKDGKARASKLTPEQRSEIAEIAAQARWRKHD